MGHFVTEGNCNMDKMFKSRGSVLKKDRSENNLSWRSEEMRFHYLCTTPKRRNYCLYLLRGDVSGRDTGKDRKWLLKNMLRISTTKRSNISYPYHLWLESSNQPKVRAEAAGSPNTIGASITQYMCIMVRGTNRLCFFYDQYLLPYHHQPIRSKKRSWMLGVWEKGHQGSYLIRMLGCTKTREVQNETRQSNDVVKNERAR